MKQYSRKGLRTNQEKQCQDSRSKVHSNSDDDSMDDLDMSDEASTEDIMFGGEEYGGEEEGEIDIDNLSDFGEEADPVQLAKDKEWLSAFIHDKLRKQISKQQADADNIRNKRIRGAI